MTFANVEQRNKNLICQFCYLQALPFARVEKNGRERIRKMYTVVPYRQARSAQLHWSFSTTSQLRWALCMLYKEQCRWPQTHCTTHVKSSLKEPQSLQTGHESRSEWNSMSWIRTWFKAWFIVTLRGVCCRRCSQPYNETAKEAVQAARRRARNFTCWTLFEKQKHETTCENIMQENDHMKTKNKRLLLSVKKSKRHWTCAEHEYSDNDLKSWHVLRRASNNTGNVHVFSLPARCTFAAKRETLRPLGSVLLSIIKLARLCTSINAYFER